MAGERREGRGEAVWRYVDGVRYRMGTVQLPQMLAVPREEPIQTYSR